MLSFSATDTHFNLSAEDTLLLTGILPEIVWRKAGDKAPWTVEKAYGFGVTSDSSAVFGFSECGFFLSVKAQELPGGAVLLKPSLYQTSKIPVQLARVNLLRGTLTEAFGTFLSLTDMKRNVFTKEERLESPYARTVGTWESARVLWPRLDDPYHTQENWANSTEVGIIRDSGSTGLVLGVTGPGLGFGDIGFGTARGNRAEVYAADLLDGILFAPDDILKLDSIFLSYGDWVTGFNDWAAQCAAEFGARVPKRPMAGYCSWYQHYAGITQAQYIKAIDEFADWPGAPDIDKVIQLDDGFQRAPGDWRPNARFPDFDGIANHIRSTDGIPGLWLAPTTVYKTDPMVEECPQAIQRMEDGSIATAFSNWEWCSPAMKGVRHNTVYLEPDHPAARERIFQIVKQAADAGYGYLKLDFTYALSTARKPYNPKKTSFQTLRDLYKLFRDAAGEDVYINACVGGLYRYTLGLADVARIGGDNGSYWGSVKRNMPEAILKACAAANWWLPDPDVFYMRSGSSKLTTEENWLVTGTIGLMGGLFMTSDYPSQWDDTARERVRYFWNADGPQKPESLRAIYNDSNAIQFLAASYADGSLRVGVYNWEDTEKDVRIGSEVYGERRAADIYPHEQAAAETEAAGVWVRHMPPHSMRIIHFC
ncbi:MAG: hypothetical protein LBR73_08630 [Oscillospiraceae bacterium]|jgi:hypothetical protein|nr:hypothetical protein [Oscillospiraceae bacterium]